ncbi:MAG: hypothetical protein JOY60_01490 [Burkholderiaceae bacterium]|nr:hypothetical protein [Roseateles sp.]MBV8468524.1 hypothetical protein [Burkholderiaceae bacterium]
MMTAMLKSQNRTESQAPRVPMVEDQMDKGRKHEAFESWALGCDRRSQARAIRYDRKR